MAQSSLIARAHCRRLLNSTQLQIHYIEGSGNRMCFLQENTAEMIYIYTTAISALFRVSSMLLSFKEFEVVTIFDQIYFHGNLYFYSYLNG